MKPPRAHIHICTYIYSRPHIRPARVNDRRELSRPRQRASASFARAITRAARRKSERARSRRTMYMHVYLLRAPEREKHLSLLYRYIRVSSRNQRRRFTQRRDLRRLSLSVYVCEKSKERWTDKRGRKCDLTSGGSCNLLRCMCVCACVCEV